MGNKGFHGFSGIKNLIEAIRQAVSVSSPADSDRFPFLQASSVFIKSITWANIKATLKTYFDDYYSPHPGLCEARLSLSSTLAIPTATITGAGTLYLHPFRGNRISLYDGTKWVEHTLSSAISFVLSGVATASTCYDIFVYNNSGTLTLDLVAWTNATTRATALALQDGVYVKSGASGRKYVGTIYVDSSKQASMEFSVSNSTTPTRRHLWNYYQRIIRTARKTSTTSSHTYASATFRKWNNDDSLRHEICIGVVEDAVAVFYGGNQHSNASIDVAINWTSGGGSFLDWFNSVTQGISAFSGGGITPPVGMSTWDVVESATSGTATFSTCVLDIILPM